MPGLGSVFPVPGWVAEGGISSDLEQALLPVRTLIIRCVRKKLLDGRIEFGYSIRKWLLDSAVIAGFGWTRELVWYVHGGLLQCSLDPITSP